MNIALKAILITAGICMGIIAVKAYKNCGRDNASYQGAIIKADSFQVGNKYLVFFKSK